MMAAVGCGRLGGFCDLPDALPKGRVLQPNMDNHEIYACRYPIFRELYNRNKELMHICSDTIS